MLDSLYFSIKQIVIETALLDKIKRPVDESSSHTALEEATAAVAGVDPIMFTTARVTTHST